MTGARDANFLGRSMIEMLGVLAIIGVLSVGGIAGYSKAMEMYKLNKWKEDFITFTFNLKTAYINSKSYYDTQKVSLVNLFKELNIIPQSMYDSYNKDVFGNTINIYTVTTITKNAHFTIQTKTLPNKFSVEQCKTIFELSQHYDDIWIVLLNEDSGVATGHLFAVKGKLCPTEYYKQFNPQPYNLQQVAEQCSVCAKQNCDIKFITSNLN